MTHGAVFDDEAFAREYARKHWKMAASFGQTYGRKLREGGFARARILDAGCGSGATNLTLAEQLPESELVGIDLSDPLLEIARRRAEEMGFGPRVDFRKADVSDIPFPDDSFDVLLNVNVVHLVEDPDRMFAEMERVLKPGGALFLADLRRSFLGLFEREIRSALSSREALDLIRRSALREGAFSSGLIWWRYESLGGGKS
jgi:ubiquinone/menaquinone biosynthesis C-methylase UbiE